MKNFAIVVVTAVRILCNVCAVFLALYFLVLFGMEVLHKPVTMVNLYLLLFVVVTWVVKGIIDWMLARLRYELQNRSKRIVRPGLKPLDA